MNTQNQHASLVERYKDADKFVKKYGLSGGMMQFSIMMVSFSWKHIPLGYYKVAFPVLICLSLYLLTKDLLTLLRVEKIMTETILEGVEYEKMHSGYGKFFHSLLQSFRFANVLMQRSVINILALGGLGYLIFQFLGNEVPVIKIDRWLFSAAVATMALLVCKLYYEPLKELDEAKETVFSKSD